MLVLRQGLSSLVMTMITCKNSSQFPFHLESLFPYKFQVPFTLPYTQTECFLALVCGEAKDLPMDGSAWMEGMREPWKEGRSSSYLPAQAACLHPTSSHIRPAVLPCSVHAVLWLPGGKNQSLF